MSVTSVNRQHTHSTACRTNVQKYTADSVHFCGVAGDVLRGGTLPSSKRHGCSDTNVANHSATIDAGTIHRSEAPRLPRGRSAKKRGRCRCEALSEALMRHWTCRRFAGPVELDCQQHVFGVESWMVRHGESWPAFVQCYFLTPPCVVPSPAGSYV